MGGAVEAIADVGLGDIVGSALDVGSVVTDLGTEFITPDTLGLAGAAFGVPGADVLSLGGFDVVGSFAGDASWFDAFNPGAILDSVPGIGDFSLGSVTNSLPSLGSITSSIPSVSDFQGYVKTAQTAISKVAPITQQVQNIAGYAGIQIPGTQILSTAAGAVSIASSGLSVASGIGSTVGKITDGVQSVIASNGILGGTFRELTGAETTALEKNINPALVNSLVDQGIARPLTYETALASGAALDPAIKSYTDEITKGQQNIASNNANIAAIESELRDENLSDNRREELEAALQANYENNAIQENIIGSNRESLAQAYPNFIADQQVIATTNNNVTRTPQDVVATTAGIPQGVVTGTSLGDLALATDPGLLPGTSARNLVQEARNQAAARSVANTQAQASDWRVRLRLAPNSTYLYNSGDPGILSSLKQTDGVIFPYTPSIETAYKANYDPYDLTHSNYRGYFYKNSYVDALNLRATFTAQDTNEANYLLAVIHFFRSATKMFYGQDPQRGSPPPLVYISGYGDFQFNEHPCVISQFNYTLPPDVDYIRAQSALNANTSMLGNRIRNPIANNPLAYAANRLLNSGLLPGALDFRPNITSNLPTGNPSYVPTKMEISISLLPIQSREQISKNFSVKEFAQGNLLKAGYW